ncbi:MAG: trigger factor [Phycisphaerae bacterium]
MDIPGLSGVTGEAELMDRAEKEVERLREELKKEVQCKSADIGTLRKELTVTVPAGVISSHLEHNYTEMRGDAIVPGFRKGRAPKRLIQKRFGEDIRDSLKTSIVGQSFLAAVEKEKLDPLGDPLFRVASKDAVKLVDLSEALQHFKLSENDDFQYVCELEIKPTFELPELKGIAIKSPQIKISDDDVAKHIERQRKNRGRYELTDQPAGDSDDLVVADVVLTSEGQEVKREENVQLGVRPTRLDGIPLMKLDETLRGVRAGDQRNTECEIPDDYERADLRGKKGAFAFTIHEVKKLAPIEEMALCEALGCSDGADLRKYVREQLESELDGLVRRAQKEQVLAYLLEHTTLDVPSDLSARQTDRAVMRKVIELQQSGLPLSDIEARIDELRTSAKADVARGLKLEFVLAKVAEKLEVEVTDEEVNSEVHRIARSYNRRFDRMRDELQQRGLLPQLAEQIRQDKCVQLILADANVVEVQGNAGDKD